jgi:hypothetical protein
MVIILFTCILTSYIFEDSDSLLVINDTLEICGDHSYAQKIHIADHSMILIRPWLEGSDSLGRLALNAPHIRIINASVINGSFRGFSGGTNSDPHGSGPGYGGAGNPGGGGGGAYGGDGGQGGDNAPGSGGSAYGSSADTLIDKGSGGGAGRLGSVDGLGGHGGASITLRAQTIIIDSSDIETFGARGNDGGIEAGGGGAGGGIMLWADSLTIRSVFISAFGGSGGDATWGGGGGGGGGRIKIFHGPAPDTGNVHYAVSGGAAGTGLYGAPEAGSAGSIYIGPVLGVQERTTKSLQNIQLYPSLTRGMIYVSAPHTPVCLLFYDCTGRLAKSIKTTSPTIQVDISDLNAGIYFVHTDGVQRSPGTMVLVK